MKHRPYRQLRRLLLAAGPAVVIALGTTHAQTPRPAAITGLHAVYDKGAFLEDRNGDEVIDFVAARIVLGENPSAAEIAAAADVAARFGFETMAMDLPMRRAGASGPLVAIGPAGVARAGIDVSSIQRTALTAGQ